ncbi:hypothetical protein [Flavobacterium sp.]|uniref:hypothetical protein n=1 Tax=Flavobacterium sp. TaxID=239 RepID=UPI00374D39A2
MNNIHKFFDDFNKLFYWLSILTSWLLTADIVGNLFLNKSINDIFIKINISDLLIIFISQIIFILTSVVIFKAIILLRFFLSKILPNNEEYDTPTEYHTYHELLEHAIKNNNQTMYNYYKDSKSDIKFNQNQKYLCFAILLMASLSLSFDNSILMIIFSNYDSYSILKKLSILIIVFLDSFGLLILFTEKGTSNNTFIKK